MNKLAEGVLKRLKGLADMVRPELGTEIERRQATLISGTSLILGLVSLVSAAVSLITAPTPQLAIRDMTLFGLGGVVLIGNFFLARRRYIVSPYIVIAAFIALTANFSLTYGVREVTAFTWPLMTIVLSAVLIGGKVIWIFGSIHTVIYVLIGIAQLEGWITVPPVPEADPSNVIPISVVQLALGGALGAVMVWFTEGLRQTVETAAARAERYRVATEFSYAVATLDLDTLLGETIELIRDRFGFYHAQVFLVDESGTWAELVASTGKVGQMLLAQGHKLAVGSRSVIGFVTEQGEPIIAPAGSPMHKPNPLLPDTKTELAVPMKVGDKVIGALDVQSVRMAAFSEDDVETLQAMANQLALAIHNARLFENVRRSAEESQRLAHQAQRSLQEIERLNRELTRRAWESYLREYKVPGLDMDMATSKTDVSEEWTPTLEEATRKRGAVVIADGEHRTVAVPIMVRGEVIGAMEFELADDEGISSTKLQLLEEAGERLGTAAENVRLFEEARRLTERERVVSNISAKLQGVTVVEDVLSTALQELGRVLGAERASVRIKLTDAASGNGGEA